MKEFTVKFNLSDGEYLTALRLVSGAVCSLCEVDVDALEDFKVCVTESVNIFKSCGYESVTAVFSTDGGVSCKVLGEGGTPKAGDNELSLALISALVENSNIEEKGGIIEKVTLRL